MSKLEALNYDIIICGGGLSGLSLAYRAIRSKVWTDEKILIIEEKEKVENDRVWSFWEKGISPFEEIIFRRWSNLTVFSHTGRCIELDHSPYVYKMIRSSDFYALTRNFLETIPNVQFSSDKVLQITNEQNYCKIKTAKSYYECKFAFSSIYARPPLANGHHYFLQHFKGLTIATEEIKINPSNAWIMDFRTPQDSGATFFYTLPLDKNKLFIEYTAFSKEVFSDQAYDVGIKRYIREVLQINNYSVVDSEQGAIPMTNYVFQRNEGNITYIGTAGGDTRGSTGYTFTNLQRTISKILDQYQKTHSPINFTEQLKFRTLLYDGTLLEVLNRNEYPPHEIFTDLFTNANGRSIFEFLDGTSTFKTDLNIMNSLKTWPFLKAFIKEAWMKVTG